MSFRLFDFAEGVARVSRTLPAVDFPGAAAIECLNKRCVMPVVAAEPECLDQVAAKKVRGILTGPRARFRRLRVDKSK